MYEQKGPICEFIITIIIIRYVTSQKVLHLNKILANRHASVSST